MPDRLQKQRKSGFAIAGTWFDAPALPAGLYVVATPIGNLGDITLRALKTLTACDLVLCEDTRFSARLLDHYAITTPKMAFHEHNERARISPIIKRLEQGQSIALICDAGTPLVSDPGFPLVRALREAGLDIFALPGPSALLGALSVSGLPTDRFTFIGFLPSRARARDTALEELRLNAQTLVFYESPRRLAAVLAAMARIFGGERQVVVALELTKKYERTLRGSLIQLAAQFGGQSQRGEAVIVVAGAPEPGEVNEGRWREALGMALKEQPLRTAVEEISQTYSIRRKQVYDAALELKS